MGHSLVPDQSSVLTLMREESQSPVNIEMAKAGTGVSDQAHERSEPLPGYQEVSLDQ